MKRRTLFGMAALLFATHAAAFEAPGIQSISYSGDGCPPDTVSASITPDGNAFSIFFSEFAAIGDKGDPSHDRADSCTISLNISGVPKQQFTITSVNFRGYAMLEDKTWGMQHTKYKFKGGQFMKPSNTKIKGPFEGEYVKQDDSGNEERGWSRCGQPVTLNIETRLQVGGPGRAYLSVDSVEGEGQPLQQDYRIKMRSCR